MNGQLPSFPYIIITFILFLWTVLWHGFALWRAAQLKQRNWFITLLVINTATIGILDIIYLFFFAKKKMTLEEAKFWKYLFN